MSQEISDILATFHDCGIESWKGDETELRLRVAATYLAQVRNEGEKYFGLTLHEIEHFEFRFWSGEIVNGIEDVLKLDLEIGYSKLEDDIVKTSCNLWTEKQGDTGGELWIVAKNPKLESENGTPMNPEELYELSNKYWRQTKT